MTDRPGLLQLRRAGADALERIKVRGDQVTVVGRPQVKDGRAVAGDAVGVLADSSWSSAW